MKGQSHVVIAAALVAAPYVSAHAHVAQIAPGNVTELGAAVVCGCLGALIPDVDQPGSRITRIRILGVRPFYFPAVIASAAGIRHRGVTHGLLAWVLASWAFLALCRLIVAVPGLEWLPDTLPAAFAFSIGYFSHLVLDCFTVEGVPLLWPKRYRFHVLPRFLRFATGSFAEKIAVTALLVVLVALAVVMAPHP